VYVDGSIFHIGGLTFTNPDEESLRIEEYRFDVTGWHRRSDILEFTDGSQGQATGPVASSSSAVAASPSGKLYITGGLNTQGGGGGGGGPSATTWEYDPSVDPTDTPE
jgi:hypothetical protein